MLLLQNEKNLQKNRLKPHFSPFLSRKLVFSFQNPSTLGSKIHSYYANLHYVVTIAKIYLATITSPSNIVTSYQTCTAILPLPPTSQSLEILQHSVLLSLFHTFSLSFYLHHDPSVSFQKQPLILCIPSAIIPAFWPLPQVQD